jgi:hypothetical protein
MSPGYGGDENPILTISYSVVKDFGFTLDEINWLGVVIGCVYLPTALLLPLLCRRIGLRRCVRLLRLFTHISSPHEAPSAT